MRASLIAAVTALGIGFGASSPTLAGPAHEFGFSATTRMGNGIEQVQWRRDRDFDHYRHHRHHHRWW
jgi:hypothetical protein